ncbi:MAG TPA: exonuclease SbcCD subunit D C-terminal domain-containing protein [Acidimicrobiia bacterium]|nr:exonuclease SbcCD subunit D C-terminal domain-containing protein [Acidimicrobiia bacterium]
MTVRILHTSDWHAGKSLRGRSRAEEHRAVFAEIVGIARSAAIDLVVVAGDLFDTAAPGPEAEQIVWQALLDLAGTGASVVALAGNHDHPARFDAARGVAGHAGITLLGRPRRPDDGGLLEFRARSGERIQVAALPFCSQRHVIKAAHLMGFDAADNALVYAQWMAKLFGGLCAGFDPGAVNILAAHLAARGGVKGGGERDAQLTEAYWVDPADFPSSAHYVALGHLHRTQSLASSAPAWYCGSPLQLDFGETENQPSVLLVEAAPDGPASVERVPLAAGRRLRTLTGTVTELAARAGGTGDDFLRVFVAEPARPGLADEVRALFPDAVDVRVVHDDDAEAAAAEASRRAGRTPAELFAEYLAGQGVADERLEALFARLLDEETEAGLEPSSVGTRR